MLWRAFLGLGFGLLLTACTDFATSECADNSVCQAGHVCDPVAGRCVLPQQISACEGAEDGAACEFVGSQGACDRGVCLASVCGDSERTGAEVCDGQALATCGELGFDRGHVGCTDSCTLDTSSCGRIGWEIVALPVEKGHFRGFWVAADGTVFASYRTIEESYSDVQGGVLVDGPNGRTTYEIAILSLWGRSPTEVYGTTEDGIHLFDGVSWEKVRDGDFDLTGIQTHLWGDEDRLFALADNDVLTSYDGTTWITEDQPYLPQIRYGDFYFSSGPEGVWKRSLDGVWQEVVSAPAAGATSTLLVSGDELALVRSEFAGNSSEVFRASGEPLVWRAESTILDYQVTGSWPSASGKIFTAGADGNFDIVDEARVAGPQWGNAPTPRIVGYGEIPIVVSTASFARLTGTHTSFAGVQTFGDSILWAFSRELMVAGGHVVGFALAGPLTNPSTILGSFTCGAWGRSDTDVLVVKYNGSVLHYDGVSWSAPPGPETPFDPEQIRCPVWADSNYYWVSGPAGSVYSFDLNVWTNHSIDTSGTVVGISGSSSGVLYALVDDDGLVAEDRDDEVDRVYRLGDTGWAEVHSDTGLREIFVADDDTVFVAGARSVRLDGESTSPLALPADVDSTLIAIHGTGADDVVALSQAGDLVHYDGIGWGKVGTSSLGAKRVFATEEDIFLGGIDQVTAVSRLRPW